MATTSDERWTDAVDYGLTRIVDLSGMDVAFGARVASDGRRLVIGRVRGARTSALQDLVVHSGTGLGGKALVLRRPVTVTDYVQARGISHQYDGPVALEGIHSIVAVPLVVAGRVAGVCYAALRKRLGIGERMQRLAISIVRETEQRLTNGSRPDESEYGGAYDWPARPEAADNSRLADICVELGTIIDRVDDPAIRAELTAIRARLATGRPSTVNSALLSEREFEALRHAAAGLPNARIAERMGLTPGTVKAYLGSVMRS